MKKIIFIIFSIVFITIGCEDDIFDRKPLSKISEADVWNDPAMLRAYLTDIYSRLPYNSKFRINWGTEGYNIATRTDLGTTSIGNINALTQGAMSRTNDALSFWNYSLIRDVNIFIEKIPDSEVAQSFKDQSIGEARVLRAMIYLEMQMRYGGVPLVDISLDPFNPIDQNYTRRSSEEAVADFIDNDLTLAIPLLSENPEPVGRINKWTAYALKARANLWAASIAEYGTVQNNGLVGIPSERANDFYTKASAAANAVISSNSYVLFNQYPDKSENYRQLFITEDNGEAIFSKVYDLANIYHSWNSQNLPQSIAGYQGALDNPSYDYILACENIDGSPDQPLIGSDYLYDNGYQAFENKDPRIKAVVFFDGDVHAGEVIRSYEGIDTSTVPDPGAILSNYGQSYMGIPQIGQDSRLYSDDAKSPNSGLMVKKFCSDELLALRVKTQWMEFRLAEMYLVRAEAEYELGNMEPAATALNATRARAGISLVDASTITRDHVRTERMSELAWEQHRWWDLRRWRIAEDVLNLRTVQGLRTILHYETGKIYYLPLDAESFSRTFLLRHYYNPITDSRINNNVDLVENPNY